MHFLELVPDASDGIGLIHRALRKPRGQQLQALSELRSSLPPLDTPEAWNTAFGPDSLFEAWTATPLMRALYAANAVTLRALIGQRPGWRILEVGGGNGALWRQLLEDDDEGTLFVVDPSEAPHARIAAETPDGVEVVSIHGAVPDVALPDDLDAVVCSLTLHHVAGRDAEARARAGLSGPGKLEALEAFRASLRARDGLLVLNEADVHCDLDIPSGDPILSERMLDSYVRRCAVALLDAISSSRDASPETLARWWVIVRAWCLDQLDLAEVPVAERDVYELDVPRWIEVLEAAGFRVFDHQFTDPWNLFHRYLASP